MTIYVRPEMFVDNTPSFAQNIAGSLGTLAGQGLSSYLQNKAIRDLQEEQNQRAKQNQELLANQLQSYGLPREIAYLPKDLQEIYFKEFLDNQRTANLQRDFTLETDESGQQRKRLTSQQLQNLAIQNPERARAITQQYEAEDRIEIELKKIESTEQTELKKLQNAQDIALKNIEAKKEKQIREIQARMESDLRKAQSAKEIEQIKAENQKDLAQIRANNENEKERLKSQYRKEENQIKNDYRKESYQLKYQQDQIKEAVKKEEEANQERLLRQGLEEQGITGSLQDIYIYGTEGGRTAITNKIVDQDSRNNYKPISSRETSNNVDDLPLEYERNNFAGLNDREVAAKRRDISKANTAYFKDEIAKSKMLTDQSRDIKTLKNLNKSKDLVTWYDRLNIDGNGNLRLPFLGSKNAQAYVKSVNRFYDGLKGTYGARITNLGVKLYGNRLPTLANSAEARELIINQMDLVNQINQIYYNALNKVYGKYKDVLNEAQIEEYTEELVKDKIAPLEQKYKDLTAQLDAIEDEVNDENEEYSFEQLPDPAKERGNEFEDESGQRYRSNGKKWIKV